MGVSGTHRRRWLGGLALGAALVMLVLGQTVLQKAFEGLVFLFYWLVCLGLTGLAILVALVDVRSTSLQLKRENRGLIENTVKQIQEDALARDGRPNRKPPKLGPTPRKPRDAGERS